MNVLLLSLLLIVYMFFGIYGLPKCTPEPPYTCPPMTSSSLGALDCRAQVMQHIQSFEGCLNCVYYDSSNKKTIGIGYLMKNADIERDFRSIGALPHYKDIINSIPLPQNQAYNDHCCCATRPNECLNQTEVADLFEISIKSHYEDAVSLLKNVPNVCCNVIVALTDVVYQFGIGRVQGEDWKQFLDLLQTEQWDAAAEVLYHCHPHGCKPQKRCDSNGDLLKKGCQCTYGGCPLGSNGKCSGGFFGPSYAVCQESKASNGTCCPYTRECSNKTAGNFTSTAKCSTCDSTCCSIGDRDTCCPKGFPHCCPNLKACCIEGYPVCCTDTPSPFCCRANQGCSYSPRACTTPKGELVYDIGNLTPS